MCTGTHDNQLYDIITHNYQEIVSHFKCSFLHVFHRDPNTSSRSGKALSETDIVANIDASEDRTGRLIDMAMQAAVDFFSTHNLNVKVPAETTQEIARSIEEGRGKLKKVAGPLIMAIGAKLITIVPLILGALALLTFKAVIVSKIALMLALFVGASKIFGGNKLGQGIGGYNANQWSGNNGWSSGSAGSYPYARSLSEAQDMAYEKQVPAQ